MNSMTYSCIAAIIIFLSAGAAVAQNMTNCARYCVRREFHDLTDAERMSLINAMKKLNQKTAGQDSKYDRLVEMHLIHMYKAHGGPQFLSWHRAYLVHLEKLLQEIDPSVCLSYWDWSREYAAPHNSIIFKYFGTSNPGGCVNDGHFANFQLKHSDMGCLYRNYDPSVGIKVFHAPQYIGELFRDSKGYAKFADSIEYIHGTPHVRIGGNLATMGSPNDPIFFMHHGFVDKLWSDYQVTLYENSLPQYDGAHKGTELKDSDVFAEFAGLRVADLLDTRDQCYLYANPGEERGNEKAKDGYKRRATTTTTLLAATSTLNPAGTPSVQPLSNSTNTISIQKSSETITQATSTMATTMPSPSSEFIVPPPPAPLDETWMDQNWHGDKEKAEEVKQQVEDTISKAQDKMEQGQAVEGPPIVDQKNRVYTGSNSASRVSCFSALLGAVLLFAIS